MTDFEFAQLAGCAPRTVWMWVAKGLLKATITRHPPTTVPMTTYGPTGWHHGSLTLSQDEYEISTDEAERFLREMMPGGKWDRRLLPDDSQVRQALQAFVEGQKHE